MVAVQPLLPSLMISKIMLLFQSHYQPAYAATLVEIPGHNLSLLVMRMACQQCQMFADQTETSKYLVKWLI